MPEHIAKHLLLMVSFVTLMSAWLGGLLGEIPKGRRGVAVVLFPISFIIPVIVGGVVVLVGVFGQYGTRGAATGIEHPLGMLAYLAETGMELCLFAVVLTPATYLWFARKGWQNAPASLSETDTSSTVPSAAPRETLTTSVKTEAALEKAAPVREEGKSDQMTNVVSSPNRWNLTPLRIVAALPNLGVLGFLVFSIFAWHRDFYQSGEINWAPVAIVVFGSASLIMNLYLIIWAPADDEMQQLAREIKKARMEKELKELKASM